MALRAARPTFLKYAIRLVAIIETQVPMPQPLRQVKFTTEFHSRRLLHRMVTMREKRTLFQNALFHPNVPKKPVDPDAPEKPVAAQGRTASGALLRWGDPA
jgi:hypothetical protein